MAEGKKLCKKLRLNDYDEYVAFVLNECLLLLRLMQVFSVEFKLLKSDKDYDVILVRNFLESLHLQVNNQTNDNIIL